MYTPHILTINVKIYTKYRLYINTSKYNIHQYILHTVYPWSITCQYNINQEDITLLSFEAN